MQEIPKLRALQVIAEVVRTRSTVAAADAAHISQPAVTQTVAKLEAAVGEVLFTRTGTGMEPTEPGRRFAQRIARAFDPLHMAERELAVPGLAGRVTSVQLRTLVAAVEAGSFTLAAARLGVSQPSVNRAMRDLESLCGRPLLTRTPQGLEPTREARGLARLAALALAEIRQGLEELREWRGQMTGRVSVGCLPLARSHLLPEAITGLLARYPEAQVRIIDGPYAEQLHELRHGGLDLIVGALRLPPPTPDIEQEVLFVEPLSIVVRANHPILAEGEPTAAALAALDWIAPREGTPARAHFASFFAAAQVKPPRHIIECSSLIASRGLLMQSDRAALLSASQVRQEVEAGYLAVLPQPLPGTERPIGLTVRKGWQPTRVQAALMELLRRGVGEGA